MLCLRNAAGYLDTVRPGEAAFYPADYWHQTWNEPDAPGDIVIGYTDTIVDRNNHHLVAPKLWENCLKPKLPNINPSAVLCQRFGHIFDWWTGAFGGGGPSLMVPPFVPPASTP